jgi:cytidylate kinase
MSIIIGGVEYYPGMYVKKRPTPAELVEQHVREWEFIRPKVVEKRKIEEEIPPTICFSRKIGSGALETADILAEQIGYKVIDRQILEYIAEDAKVSGRTVAIFDERFPGRRVELSSMLFGEKSFMESDYARHLANVVLSVAHLGQTIFVGRGTHLVLPRERVMAVRFISSRDFRIKRIAKILNVPEKEVDKKIDKMDEEQRDFFKKVYGKKEAPPYEFDIVINCDYVKPKSAANIIAQAFRDRFF